MKQAIKAFPDDQVLLDLPVELVSPALEAFAARRETEAQLV